FPRWMPSVSRWIACNHTHAKFAIGVPGVAATVYSVQDFVKPVDDRDFRQISRSLQIVEEVVAFRIDIGCGVMRDLACRVTEADSLVEDAGTNPDGAAV